MITGALIGAIVFIAMWFSARFGYRQGWSDAKRSLKE